MDFVDLKFDSASNKIEILFKEAGDYDTQMIFAPLKGKEQTLSSKFKVIEPMPINIEPMPIEIEKAENTTVKEETTETTEETTKKRNQT